MRSRLADALLVIVLLTLLSIALAGSIVIKPFLPNWIASIVNSCLFLMFIGWLIYADSLRRRNQLREQPIAITDERQCVLYLRSFVDDKTPIGLFGQQEPSFEDTLVAVLSKIGPVIALGQPGEKLPPVGANRIYLGDSWRQELQQLLATVKVVVIRTGMTPSLLWELDVVIRTVSPHRIVLAMPSDDSYRAFIGSSQHMFPRGLPSERGSALFLAFDDDWNALALSAPRWKRLFLTKTAMRDALRPFVARLAHRRAVYP